MRRDLDDITSINIGGGLASAIRERGAGGGRKNALEDI